MGAMPWAARAAGAAIGWAAMAEAGGKLLSALGVPNFTGRISWPLGLQVLVPQDKTNELLDRIETLLQVAATQEVQGQVNTNLLQEANTAVDELHGMLRKRHTN